MTQTLEQFIKNPPLHVDIDQLEANRIALIQYSTLKITMDDESEKLFTILMKKRMKVSFSIQETIRIVQFLKTSVIECDFSSQKQIEDNVKELCRRVRETVTEIMKGMRFKIAYESTDHSLLTENITNLRLGIPDGEKECKFIYDTKIDGNIKHKTLDVLKLRNIYKIK